MKWALAFATAGVLAEKIEFLEMPLWYFNPEWTSSDYCKLRRG